MNRAGKARPQDPAWVRWSLTFLAAAIMIVLIVIPVLQVFWGALITPGLNAYVDKGGSLPASPWDWRWAVAWSSGLIANFPLAACSVDRWFPWRGPLCSTGKSS